MQQRLKRMSAIVVGSFMVAWCCCASAGEMRTWRAATGGYSVEAELLEVKAGDIARLKTKDGREIDVPLAQLTTADQDFARKQAQPAPGAQAPAGASAKFTKVFRMAERCRTPQEALLVFKVFYDDPTTTPADETAAAAKIAEYKQLAAEKKVRLNREWVPAEQANAVRKKADELMRQGLELWKLDQEDAFRRKFAEAAALESELVRADFLAGLIYTAGRDIDKALPLLQRCLSRDPENVAVLNNVALLSAAKGDWTAMMLNWRKAITLQPDQRVLHNVGRFLNQAPQANLNIPKQQRDGLAIPYAELVGTGKYTATDPTVGWLFMLIEESDLDISFDKDKGKESDKKSIRPETTEDGPVVGGGTGFVVHPGYVLTNAHVAEDDGVFEIQASDGRLLKATRIAKADKADLALLKCEELQVPALPLATALAPRGSDIMLLGFPEMFNLGASLKATRGSISSVPDAQFNDMYLYDAVTNSGNSGGPVCNDCGNVVAVHAAGINTASRYGGGVPSLQAVEFLKTAIPEAQLAAPNSVELEWPEVDAKVSPSTVLIWVRKKSGVSRSKAGSDSIEFPLCMFCGGGGKLRCGYAGCVKGTVATKAGRRNPCPSCEGTGGVTCTVCGGVGVDVQLASVQSAIQRAAAAKAAAENPQPTTTTSNPMNGGSPTIGSRPVDPKTGNPYPNTTAPTNSPAASRVPVATARATTPIRLHGKPIVLGPRDMGYDPGAHPMTASMYDAAQLPKVLEILRGSDAGLVGELAREMYSTAPDPTVHKQVAELLEKWVRDSTDWKCQCDCLRALIVWRRQESMSVFINALRDPSWPLRRQAGIAIVMIGDPIGIVPLVEAMHKPEVENALTTQSIDYERWLWKRCLIGYGDAARSEVEKLKDDPDEKVNKAVAEILNAYDGLPPPGATGSSQVRRATVAYSSNGKKIRLNLGDLREGMMPDLGFDPGAAPSPRRKQSSGAFAEIVASLRDGDAEAIKEMTSRLFESARDDGHAGEVAEQLERHARGHTNWVVRTHCVRALGVWSRPESAAVLHTLLRDKNWAVRRQAGISIVQSNDASGVALLIECLKKPGDVKAEKTVNVEQERAHWKKCLRVWGKSAQAQIEALKNDPDEAVRAAAEEILAEYATVNG